MTCLHNQLHNSVWTESKQLSPTFKTALLPETLGIYRDRSRDEIPVLLTLQLSFSTQTQLRNPRLVIQGLSSVDYTLLYIQVIHKHMRKIRYGDTSRINLQWTYKCLTTLITMHQVTLAPRTTCIAVKNCNKWGVRSSRSYIKLSTLLNASLPCVPFLFAISWAGNNTSVKNLTNTVEWLQLCLQWNTSGVVHVCIRQRNKAFENLHS